MPESEINAYCPFPWMDWWQWLNYQIDCAAERRQEETRLQFLQLRRDILSGRLSNASN